MSSTPEGLSDSAQQAEQDMNEAEVEAARAKNVALGKEILAVIHRVEGRQTYWKGVLEESYRVEAEQHSKMLELEREVLINEAECLSNAQFMQWMGQRKQAGVDDNAVPVREWFHSDVLALETPFTAMVPFPSSVHGGTQLSSNGEAFFVESVSDLMRDAQQGGGDAPSSANSHPWYVSTIAVGHPLSNVADTYSKIKRASHEKSRELPYLEKPCTTGVEVMELIRRDEGLQKALETTSCAFFASRLLDFVVVARVVVIGGFFTLCEVGEASASPSGSLVESALGCLSEFVDETLTANLPKRTFIALVAAQAAEKRPCGVRWTLLNLGVFSQEALECFSPDEVSMVARVLCNEATRRGCSTIPGQAPLFAKPQPITRRVCQHIEGAEVNSKEEQMRLLSLELYKALGQEGFVDVPPPRAATAAPSSTVDDTGASTATHQDPTKAMEDKTSASTIRHSTAALVTAVLGTAIATVGTVLLVTKKLGK